MNTFRESHFKIVEASGTSGLNFKIVIIEEGLSKNGNYYPKETLLKSRTLFEGAKVCYYEFKGDYNHLPEETRMKMPHGFPNQVAGIVTDVKLEKLKTGKFGLVGILKMTEANRDLADIFKLGLENGNEEVLGFSIDVYGRAKKENIEGKEVDVVTEIDQVNEVTIVTNPAAGGRLERMVASVYNNKKEKGKMKENLIKLLMSLKPEKLEKIQIFEATDDQVKSLWTEAVNEIKVEFKENNELQGAVEALLAAVDSASYPDAVEAAKKVKELMKMGKVEGKTELKEKDKEPGEEAGKHDHSVDHLSEIKKVQESMELRLCESNLRAHLAESKLPETAKERIKERFTGKRFVEEDLVKEIDSERKYIAKLVESQHPAGYTVEVGETSMDKKGDAIEGMLLGVDVNKIPRFKSIHEAFAKTDNVNPFDGNFKDKLWNGMVKSARNFGEMKSLKEAVATSGFTEVLGDRLRKVMIKEYSEAGLDDWKKICNIASPKDFYTNRVVKLGGYGTNMPTVAEAGSYTALTSPTDEEATYAVGKKGGLESISMEAIKNDNLRALQMIPKRLGRGAANTLYQFVFEFVNPATNPTIYDTVALYNAAHGSNSRTAALSYAEFNNVAIVLMDQTGYNEANFFLDNKPKYILVPNELWVTATEIAKSNVALSASRAETVPNSYSEWNVEVIRVPYWTDSNNFATMSDPAKVAGLEIGFLDGNEEPELLQEAANSGSDFTNDQLRYKLRHIYGGAIVDFRPFVGNIVP